MTGSWDDLYDLSDRIQAMSERLGFKYVFMASMGDADTGNTITRGWGQVDNLMQLEVFEDYAVDHFEEIRENLLKERRDRNRPG